MNMNEMDRLKFEALMRRTDIKPKDYDVISAIWNYENGGRKGHQGTTLVQELNEAKKAIEMAIDKLMLKEINKAELQSYQNIKQNLWQANNSTLLIETLDKLLHLSQRFG